MSRPTWLPRRFLLRILRFRLVSIIARWMFTRMNFTLPVKRLRETEHLVAFHHPFPSYPVHILLVPRRAVSGLAELGSEDAPFLIDLFLTVQELVATLELEPSRYRLIANGGKYQEFPYLHFHLVSGEDV